MHAMQREWHESACATKNAAWELRARHMVTETMTSDFDSYEGIHGSMCARFGQRRDRTNERAECAKWCDCFFLCFPRNDVIVRGHNYRIERCAI